MNAVLEPAKIDLKMTRGLTFPGAILNCKDPDTGQAIDLTGVKPFAEVRKKPGMPVILDLAPAITDAPNGVVQIPVKDIDETGVTPRGEFHWDFTLEQEVSGERFGPFAVGNFSIGDIITRGDPPEPES